MPGLQSSLERSGSPGLIRNSETTTIAWVPVSHNSHDGWCCYWHCSRAQYPELMLMNQWTCFPNSTSSVVFVAVVAVAGVAAAVVVVVAVCFCFCPQQRDEYYRQVVA